MKTLIARIRTFFAEIHISADEYVDDTIFGLDLN